MDGVALDHGQPAIQIKNSCFSDSGLALSQDGVRAVQRAMSTCSTFLDVPTIDPGKEVDGFLDSRRAVASALKMTQTACNLARTAEKSEQRCSKEPQTQLGEAGWARVAAAWMLIRCSATAQGRLLHACGAIVSKSELGSGSGSTVERRRNHSNGHSAADNLTAFLLTLRAASHCSAVPAAGTCWSIDSDNLQRNALKQKQRMLEASVDLCGAGLAPRLSSGSAARGGQRTTGVFGPLRADRLSASVTATSLSLRVPSVAGAWVMSRPRPFTSREHEVGRGAGTETVATASPKLLPGLCSPGCGRGQSSNLKLEMEMDAVVAGALARESASSGGYSQMVVLRQCLPGADVVNGGGTEGEKEGALHGSARAGSGILSEQEQRLASGWQIGSPLSVTRGGMGMGSSRGRDWGRTRRGGDEDGSEGERDRHTSTGGSSVGPTSSYYACSGGVLERGDPRMWLWGRIGASTEREE